MKDKRVEVLKLLIDRGEEELNISSLSKLTGIDYKNAYNIVKRLNAEGLVRVERFGKALRCTLNRKNHPLIFEAENERRKRLLENRDMGVLSAKLDRLPFPIVALIFGSYARGQAEKGSDIDLMVICEKNRAEEVERTLSLLPLSIHLTVLTWEEFLAMAKSREFTVVSQALKYNVIITGIEDYYRLMENAG
jgi:DNA-binding MarR family transcriptional regulator